ncbi:hypothetical protein VQ042_19000 [Aurantimonas sp. A2-1-M11]|uniref:hypothetical protein n=1 Tax=Aurantimonas sp. A2-1-M11 TaxID=3113712 RepID=UPI002F939153
MARTIPVCSGSDQAERKLTRIVDGETGGKRGVRWRALNVKPPEMSQLECAAESGSGWLPAIGGAS